MKVTGCRFSIVALALSSLALESAPRLAYAVPALGEARSQLHLVDAWDRRLDIQPANPGPVLVVYEDKESATQNAPLKSELARLATRNPLAAKVMLVAIADVSAYNFWPVRGFVKSAIQREAERFQTDIFCDWDGSVRAALGVHEHASSVVLYGPDGSVRFGFEGPMPAEKRAALLALLDSATRS